MSTITFHMIKRRGSKCGTCIICGKRATRSITLEQSINPWNKNKDGYPKSASEIHDELVKKINEWRAEPIRHSGCEGAPEPSAGER